MSDASLVKRGGLARYKKTKTYLKKEPAAIVSERTERRKKT